MVSRSGPDLEQVINFAIEQMCDIISPGLDVDGLFWGCSKFDLEGTHTS